MLRAAPDRHITAGLPALFRHRLLPAWTVARLACARWIQWDYRIGGKFPRIAQRFGAGPGLLNDCISKLYSRDTVHKR